MTPPPPPARIPARPRRAPLLAAMLLAVVCGLALQASLREGGTAAGRGAAIAAPKAPARPEVPTSELPPATLEPLEARAREPVRTTATPPRIAEEHAGDVVLRVRGPRAGRAAGGEPVPVTGRLLLEPHLQGRRLWIQATPRGPGVLREGGGFQRGLYQHSPWRATKGQAADRHGVSLREDHDFRFDALPAGTYDFHLQGVGWIGPPVPLWSDVDVEAPAEGGALELGTLNLGGRVRTSGLWVADDAGEPIPAIRIASEHRARAPAESASSRQAGGAGAGWETWVRTVSHSRASSQEGLHELVHAAGYWEVVVSADGFQPLTVRVAGGFRQVMLRRLTGG